MEVLETSFADAKIIIPEVHADYRGYFKETYHITKHVREKLWMNWAQDGVSYSKNKYTVRGLHYQPYMAKLVQVLAGAVYDVIVDIRPDSPTYKQWEGFNLTAENHNQLLVPVGFLHGFMTLEDNTVFSYKMSDVHNAGTEKAVYFKTPELGIFWPYNNMDDIIISKKDMTASNFLPETYP